jgi:intein/homing endonuclease
MTKEGRMKKIEKYREGVEKEIHQREKRERKYMSKEIESFQGVGFAKQGVGSYLDR